MKWQSVYEQNQMFSLLTVLSKQNQCLGDQMQ